MSKSVLKVKNWKERNAKFDFGVGAVIRLSDQKLFYLNYAYNAYGYVAGTTVEIHKAYADKIHVDVEIISANEIPICFLRKIDIDRLLMFEKSLYIKGEPDCAG